MNQLCEWCGEKEMYRYNNQGDMVCVDCEKDSQQKCDYCKEKNIAEYKTLHNTYVCCSSYCKENYLTSYCLEKI